MSIELSGPTSINPLYSHPGLTPEIIARQQLFCSEYEDSLTGLIENPPTADCGSITLESRPPDRTVKPIKLLTHGQLQEKIDLLNDTQSSAMIALFTAIGVAAIAIPIILFVNLIAGCVLLGVAAALTGYYICKKVDESKLLEEFGEHALANAQHYFTYGPYKILEDLLEADKADWTEEGDDDRKLKEGSWLDMNDAISKAFEAIKKISPQEAMGIVNAFARGREMENRQGEEKLRSEIAQYLQDAKDQLG